MAEMSSSRGVRTAAQGMLLLVGGLIALFGISAAFSSDTAYDDRVLAATFGGGMGLFAIALTLVAFGGRDRRAWWVLWILPCSSPSTWYCSARGCLTRRCAC